MKFLTLGLLSFAILPCAESNLRAAEAIFKVRGLLHQYNNAQLAATFDFTASVKDCQWLIRTTTPEGSSVEYYEDAYDGENVYHYLQFRGQPQNNTANSSGGAIEINDIPNNKADYAIPVWLAFGSHCYFDTVKGHQVKSFFDWAQPDRSMLNRLIEVDFKRSDQPPHAPTYIYSKDLNRIYRVLDFTNFGGLLLPKEFVVECFRPGLDIATNRPVFSYHGILSEISGQVAPQNFAPILDGRTYTEDRRFVQRTPPISQINYLNKSNQWLSTNDPQLIALSGQQRLFQPPETTAHPHRALVLILLVCPTLIFAIAVILRFKRREKQ